MIMRSFRHTVNLSKLGKFKMPKLRPTRIVKPPKQFHVKPIKG